MQPGQHRAERRLFLKLAGAAPLTLIASAAWLSLACGESEPYDPYASREDDDGATEDGPAPAADEDEASETASAPQESAQGAGEAAQPADPSTALVTEVAAMEATVEALQYTNQTQKPDQRCDGCQFYTATGDARGSCQLFPQGKVAAGGWCTSWAKKLDA